MPEPKPEPDQKPKEDDRAKTRIEPHVRSGLAAQPITIATGEHHANPNQYRP